MRFVKKTYSYGREKRYQNACMWLKTFFCNIRSSENGDFRKTRRRRRRQHSSAGAKSARAPHVSAVVNLIGWFLRARFLSFVTPQTKAFSWKTKIARFRRVFARREKRRDNSRLGALSLQNLEEGGKRTQKVLCVFALFVFVYCFYCCCCCCCCFSNIFLRRRFSKNNIGGKKALFSVWEPSCMFALLTFCADFLGFTGYPACFFF